MDDRRRWATAPGRSIPRASPWSRRPWRARTNRATPIAAGAGLRVVAIDGVTLEVEPRRGRRPRDYALTRPRRSQTAALTPHRRSSTECRPELTPVVVASGTVGAGTGRRPTASPAKGMPVLLLHGWALAQHTYRGVIEAVAAQGCRVIAPAMPGFGGTGGAAQAPSFSISGYANGSATSSDVLEIDEPAVVDRPLLRRRRRHPLRPRASGPRCARSCWSTRSAARRGERATRCAASPSGRCGTGVCTSRPTCGRCARRRRCVPVMAEDFVPNMLRNPRAMCASPTWPAVPTCATSWSSCATSGLPITIMWAPATGSSRGVVRGAVRRLRRGGHGHRGLAQLAARRSGPLRRGHHQRPPRRPGARELNRCSITPTA